MVGEAAVDGEEEAGGGGGGEGGEEANSFRASYRRRIISLCMHYSQPEKAAKADAFLAYEDREDDPYGNSCDNVRIRASCS
jgi:hypothetical protein